MNLNWNDTRCEGEEEERIKEMLSNNHIKEVMNAAHSTKNQYPEVIIFYQVTCKGCESRLTDSDPMTLAVEYRCDECEHVTKTIDGDLGHLGVMLPEALRNQFLEGFGGTTE